jgi:hypothetical protein
MATRNFLLLDERLSEIHAAEANLKKGVAVHAAPLCLLLRGNLLRSLVRQFQGRLASAALDFQFTAASAFH